MFLGSGARLVDHVVKGNFFFGHLRFGQDQVDGLIIESMATAYEDPKEVIEYYQKNEQMLNGVRNLAVEDQAIDLILSKAQVTEKEVAFDDVINKSGAAA